MYTTFFMSAYMSCIELAYLSNLSGEFEAKLMVRLTGEGEVLRALPILNALVAVLVKLIFSTLLVLNKLIWLLG